MKMRDRLKVMEDALQQMNASHSIMCVNPNVQLATNAEGLAGIVCFSCNKVVELPKLSNDLSLNRDKWLEALKEIKK